MEYRYEIYPASRAIVGRISGRARLEELMQLVHALWADPRYSPAFDGVMDLEKDFGLAMSDFRPLLDYLRQHPRTSSGRWAVVTNSPLTTACGFIYRHTMAGRHSFDVFSTREAACAFVGFQLGPGDLFAEGNRPRRWASPARGRLL